MGLFVGEFGDGFWYFDWFVIVDIFSKYVLDILIILLKELKVVEVIEIIIMY